MKEAEAERVGVWVWADGGLGGARKGRGFSSGHASARRACSASRCAAWLPRARPRDCRPGSTTPRPARCVTAIPCGPICAPPAAQSLGHHCSPLVAEAFTPGAAQGLSSDSPTPRALTCFCRPAFGRWTLRGCQGPPAPRCGAAYRPWRVTSRPARVCGRGPRGARRGGGASDTAHGVILSVLSSVATAALPLRCFALSWYC